MRWQTFGITHSPAFADIEIVFLRIVRHPFISSVSFQLSVLFLSSYQFCFFPDALCVGVLLSCSGSSDSMFFGDLLPSTLVISIMPYIRQGMMTVQAMDAINRPLVASLPKTPRIKVIRYSPSSRITPAQAKMRFILSINSPLFWFAVCFLSFTAI